MTEATSGYLNREPRTESEAKSGRMVTLQLTVGELREGRLCLLLGIGHAADLDEAEHPDKIETVRRRLELYDRLSDAIKEALNDD